MRDHWEQTHDLLVDTPNAPNNVLAHDPFVKGSPP